jgi:acetyl-CoA synthetase
MALIDRFCKTDFKNYADFKENFKINIPENFNYGYDVIDAIAEEKPNKIAMVWCNDKGDERTFTFEDIKKLSNRTANFLKAQGLKKGDFVLLTLKRHYEFWIAMIALHKMGVVAIPATHMLTTKDFKYRFDMANVKAIITTGENDILDYVDEAAATAQNPVKIKILVHGKREGYLDFDEEIMKYSDEFPRPTGEDATCNDDLLLCYFTSGTTGHPKMVVHNQIYPLGHILTAKFWHDLKDTDLCIAVADSGWAKCAWGKLYGQWICEAALFIYDYDARFKPIDLVRVSSQHHVTVFCAPPTIYRFLIQEDLSQFDMSSLRHCCTAGEPLNPEVYNRWKEMTGIEIKEGFGQTETCVLIATTPYIKPKQGSTGRPNPHVNTMIVAEDGHECEVGEVGEICIPIQNGIPAGITVGYYKDPEKTAEVMRGGFYHTGDMAWKDEDGYIFFEGRSDDVIKSSGYRIGPFEVESALLEHPAVLEAAITAVPHPVRGQIVKATIVLVKNGKYQPSDELIKELQDHVKHTTAPYKYPRIIEFVDELPKTIGGKIKRKEIRTADENKHQQ